MKKYITSIFLGAVLAASASAEYLTLTSENNKYTAKIPAATLSNYTGFTGEIFDYSYSTGSPTVGSFTQDFTFDSGMNITSTVNGNNNFTFDIKNNVVVTVNETLNISAVKSFRLWVGTAWNDSNRGKLVINSSVNKTGTNTPLMFILNKEVELNGTSPFSEFNFFSNGSLKINNNVTAQIGFRSTNQLYDGTISKAFKVDSSKDGVRNIGTIILDGASYTATGYYYNAGDETNYGLNTYQHVFTVQFAQDKVAEAFNLNNAESMNNDRKFSYLMGLSTFDGWLFEGMSKNDTICSAYDLTSEAYASKIFVNDNTLAELIESGAIEVSKDSTYNYIYTMTIPEPSTYAMILGALALGFVAYRRRK